jgi:N-acetylglucosamine kinase-like BadF-type ATPase
MYFAGIDGGQSSSLCAIAGDDGAVLARVTGPPADLVGEPLGSQRQAGLIDALLARARAAAGIANDTEFAAVVAGISGAGEEAPPDPAPRTPNVRVVHDSEIAHAGAFDGGPGILVIAGTGSVALGIDADGRRARAGGWGFYFGDEGSALWTVRTAARFAMEEHDRGRTTAVEQVLLAALAQPSLRAVQDGFARGTIDRVRLASAAPAIAELAAVDGAARLILDAAARALAELAAIVADRVGTAGVSYCGGMFAPPFVESFTAQLKTLRPALDVQPPRHPPEFGALLLARRAAGPLAAT